MQMQNPTTAGLPAANPALPLQRDGRRTSEVGEIIETIPSATAAAHT